MRCGNRIDFERVDLPVRIYERSGILCDIVDAASPGVSPRVGSATVRDKGLACPRSAEGQIKDDGVVIKVAVNVAATCEASDWFTERAGIRGSVADGKRD